MTVLSVVRLSVIGDYDRRIRGFVSNFKGVASSGLGSKPIKHGAQSIMSMIFQIV